MHPGPSRTRACALLAAVALAAAACSGEGSGVDKAGGTRAKPPVVLTLADHEQGPDQVQAWIEEVQRRAGGSLRIQVTNHWRDQEVAYDKATIADVQAGKVALAKIAAGPYDTVGIDSFQALVAPLLIDNPTLERRVLESDLATKMLAGTDELGLVGLAVLPTDLRKPLGVTRLLVRAGDYRGARMGVGEGEVAKATVTALGATPVSTIPGGPLRGLDGLDIDLGSIKWNGYEQQATALTANVTLWPRPVTVVINRTVLESLTAAQQDALRQAGTAAVSRQLAFLRGLNDEDRALLCRRGLRFVRAGDRDLAGLRRAVQPVYDPARGQRPDQAVAAAHPGDEACHRRTPRRPGLRTLGVRHGCGRPASDRARRGLPDQLHPQGARQLAVADGPSRDQRPELGQAHAHAGSRARHLRAAERACQRQELGHFTVNGDAIVLTFTAGVNAGETFAMRWSLYRDVLSFKRDASLGGAPTSYLVKPWRRAG
jgi:TRAP-type C4-dicarboxylate transport system substrate-binding protein